MTSPRARARPSHVPFNGAFLRWNHLTSNARPSCAISPRACLFSLATPPSPPPSPRHRPDAGRSRFLQDLPPASAERARNAPRVPKSGCMFGRVRFMRRNDRETGKSRQSHAHCDLTRLSLSLRNWQHFSLRASGRSSNNSLLDVCPKIQNSCTSF